MCAIQMEGTSRRMWLCAVGGEHRAWLRCGGRTPGGWWWNRHCQHPQQQQKQRRRWMATQRPRRAPLWKKPDLDAKKPYEKPSVSISRTHFTRSLLYVLQKKRRYADTVRVHMAAGKGGNGVVSFFRDKNVATGPADGGTRFLCSMPSSTMPTVALGPQAVAERAVTSSCWPLKISTTSATSPPTTPYGAPFCCMMRVLYR